MSALGLSQTAEALRPLAGNFAYLLFAAGINPITALYCTAALNYLAAPPLMALVIMIANRKGFIGQFVNSKASNVLGWVIVMIMSMAGVVLIFNLATGQLFPSGVLE